MIICIDFDGTLVSDERAYDDVVTPFKLLPGALQALKALKAAGHSIVVFSARANRALLIDPMLDPLTRLGLRPRGDAARWAESKRINHARYQHMVHFCETTLKGLVDAVDDGVAGKPICDLFIDDKALSYGRLTWGSIAARYGEQGE